MEPFQGPYGSVNGDSGQEGDKEKLRLANAEALTERGRRSLKTLGSSCPSPTQVQEGMDCGLSRGQTIQSRTTIAVPQELREGTRPFEGLRATAI